MGLPNNRYSTNAEYCGYDKPRFVPRFCGEWLRDSEIWPDRAGFQSPSFETKQGAIQACVAYEEMRQSKSKTTTKMKLRGGVISSQPPDNLNP